MLTPPQGQTAGVRQRIRLNRFSNAQCSKQPRQNSAGHRNTQACTWGCTWAWARACEVVQPWRAMIRPIPHADKTRPAKTGHGQPNLTEPATISQPCMSPRWGQSLCLLRWDRSLTGHSPSQLEPLLDTDVGLEARPTACFSLVGPVSDRSSSVLSLRWDRSLTGHSPSQLEPLLDTDVGLEARPTVCFSQVGPVSDRSFPPLTPHGSPDA
jgi:hypothetical protein